eukprot:TRINITY_DN9599_c0_g1_i1.p2 TRINITY_DN9599_c0_g1~~TRINITY_DN9599_c0_g1_i1.p2  ORF type:complete len:136 (+),score=30.43 TRINITY_DN9599_c0_g1_i1:94-501(+)
MSKIVVIKTLCCIGGVKRVGGVRGNTLTHPPLSVKGGFVSVKDGPSTLQQEYVLQFPTPNLRSFLFPSLPPLLWSPSLSPSLPSPFFPPSSPFFQQLTTIAQFATSLIHLIQSNEVEGSLKDKLFCCNHSSLKTF